MIGDTDGDGENDDAIYFVTSRPNFYDVDTTYDLDDIDGDGVANDDDAALLIRRPRWIRMVMA